MKPFLAALLISAAAAFLAGCETFQGSSSSAGPSLTSEPPRLGMTKAQVQKMYGDPDRRTFTSRGEVWIYWLNRPALISLSPSYQTKTAGFIFDGQGILQDFHFTE